MAGAQLGPLLASGRDADVHAAGAGLVVRRNRDGRAVAAEAEVMVELHGLGFPVPRVVSWSGPDLLMERVDGPTLTEAVLAGQRGAAEAGDLLARLHADLHGVPWPGDEPLLHLDLHPGNVLLGPRGPVVIDWTDARPGPPELDAAMTALLVAQAALVPGVVPAEHAGEVHVLLAAYVTGHRRRGGVALTEHLAQAAAIRLAQPHLPDLERASIDEAVALVASL